MWFQVSRQLFRLLAVCLELCINICRVMTLFGLLCKTRPGSDFSELKANDFKMRSVTISSAQCVADCSEKIVQYRNSSICFKSSERLVSNRIRTGKNAGSSVFISTNCQIIGTQRCSEPFSMCFSIKRRKKWWTLKKIKNLCGIVGLVKINLKKYIPKYLIVEQFIKGLNEQEKNLADFAEISDLEVSNYMKLFFSTNRVPTNGMFGSLSSRFVGFFSVPSKISWNV